MVNINWKVRLKNPSFWVGIVSALGVFAVSIFALIGIDISGDVNGMVESISTAIVALFSVGAAFGVIADPTTQGLSDSKEAMTYTVPKPKCVGTGCEVGEVKIDEIIYADGTHGKVDNSQTESEA